MFNPKKQKLNYSAPKFSRIKIPECVEVRKTEEEIRESLYNEKQKLYESGQHLSTFGEHLFHISSLAANKTRVSQKLNYELSLQEYMIMYEIASNPFMELKKISGEGGEPAVKALRTKMMNALRGPETTTTYLYDSTSMQKSDLIILYRDKAPQGETLEAFLDFSKLYLFQAKSKEEAQQISQFIQERDAYKMWRIFDHHIYSTKFTICQFDKSEKMLSDIAKNQMENINTYLKREGLDPEMHFIGVRMNNFRVESIHTSYLSDNLKQYGEEKDTIWWDSYGRKKISAVTEVQPNPMNHPKLSSQHLKEIEEAAELIAKSLKSVEISSQSKINISGVSMAILSYRQSQSVQKLKDEFEMKYKTQDNHNEISYEVTDPDREGEQKVIVHVKVVSNTNPEIKLEDSFEIQEQSFEKQIEFSISDQIGYRRCLKIMDANVEAKLTNWYYGEIWKAPRTVLFALWAQERIINGKDNLFQEKRFLQTDNSKIDLSGYKSYLERVIGNQKVLITVWETSSATVLHKNSTSIVTGTEEADVESMSTTSSTDTSEDNIAEGEVEQVESSKGYRNPTTRERFFLKCESTKYAFHPFKPNLIYVDGEYVPRTDEPKARRIKAEKGAYVAVPRVVTIDAVTRKGILPMLSRIYLSLMKESRIDFVWKRQGEFSYLHFVQGRLEICMSEVEVNLEGYTLLQNGSELVGYKTGQVLVKAETRNHYQERERGAIATMDISLYSSTCCLHQDVRGIVSNPYVNPGNFKRRFITKERVMGAFRRALPDRSNKTCFTTPKVFFENMSVTPMSITQDMEEESCQKMYVDQSMYGTVMISGERHFYMHLYFEFSNQIEIQMASYYKKKQETKGEMKMLNGKPTYVRNFETDEFWENCELVEREFGRDNAKKIRKYLMYKIYIPLELDVKDVFLLHHDVIQYAIHVCGGEGEIIVPRANPRDGLVEIDGQKRFIEVKTSASFYRAGLNVYDTKYFNMERIMATFQGVALTPGLDKWFKESFFNKPITRMEILLKMNGIMTHLRNHNEALREFSREALTFGMDATTRCGPLTIPRRKKNWKPLGDFIMPELDETTKLEKKTCRKLCKGLDYDLSEKTEKTIVQEGKVESRFNSWEQKIVGNFFKRWEKPAYIPDDEWETEKDIVKENWEAVKEDRPDLIDGDMVNETYDFCMYVYQCMFYSRKEVDESEVEGWEDPDDLENRLLNSEGKDKKETGEGDTSEESEDEEPEEERRRDQADQAEDSQLEEMLQLLAEEYGCDELMRSSLADF